MEQPAAFLKDSPAERPFWELLPEIYRQDPILSKLISIFEGMFLGIEKEIDALPKTLYDPLQTPEAFLSFVGRLAGLRNDCGQFTPEQMRKLLPEAFRLQRWKGTRKALSRLLELYLESLCGHPVSPVILEYEDFCEAQGAETYERLFGGEENVTVLFPVEEALAPLEEQERIRRLIQEYTPACVNVNVWFLQSRFALGKGFLGRSGLL